MTIRRLDILIYTKQQYIITAYLTVQSRLALIINVPAHLQLFYFRHMKIPERYTVLVVTLGAHNSCTAYSGCSGPVRRVSDS